jgi:hypothetical protein
VSLTFPGWYEGGFPDREQVVMDALAPVLSVVDVFDGTGAQILDNQVPRRPLACTFLPANYRDVLPILRIHRTGGASDVNAITDPAVVQVAAIAETRADSWELLEYCRQWLLTYRDGGTVVRANGSHTVIDKVEELVGPQQLPELNPDFRMVPFQFRVTCRRPRGIPDYQKRRDAIVAALLA